MKNLSSINESQDIVNKKYVDELAETKVNKVDGKGLSTNDFTNEDKEKLDSLSEQSYTLPVASEDAIGGVKSGTDITVDNEGNVSVNDNSHKHTASNISDLDSYISSKVSTPGYSDITGKPTLNGVTIEGTKTSEDYSIADAEHSHDVSDITGLTATVDELNYVDGVTSNIQTQLNNKASSTHNHTANQITDLSKTSVGLGNVENKSSATIRSEITSGNVTTALGFTPAEDEHTHTISEITDLSKSSVGLGNVENKSSATIRGEITSSNVTTALGYTPLNSNLKGANSGVAELDANGKVPTSQLPSYVDDVLEYSAKASFPATGEAGKIYIDLATNLTYRWSGSAYTEISPSLALGETSSTAYRGDRGKTAYDHSQVKDGSNPHGTTFANIASRPTTISGYGITDAKIASGTITLGSNSITPLTSSSSLDATKLTGTASINTTGKATTAGTADALKGVTATATELNYVDGVTSNIQTQLNAKAVNKTLTNENLNDVKTPGFYNAGGSNSVTNKPSGVDHFGMEVIHYANGEYYVQIVYNNSGSYRRRCDNGTWSSWVQDKLTDTTYTLSSFGITATAAELNYVDGVTSNVQTQLNNKLNTNGSGANLTSLNATQLTSGTVPAARLPKASTSALGAVKIGSGLSVDVNGVISVAGGSGKTEVAVQTAEPTDTDIVLWIDPSSDGEALSIINYKGAYSSSESYSVSDIVYYNNVWFMCHADVKGVAPDVSKQFSDPYWYPFGINKSYVDTQITSHTHTANKITSGTFPAGVSCSTPTNNAHLANKEYADTKISGSGIVSNVWTGTQEQYDAIATKSATTLYLIQG